MQPPMLFKELDLGTLAAAGDQSTEHECENRHFMIAGLALIGTVFSAAGMVASRALKVYIVIASVCPSVRLAIFRS